MDRWQGRMRTWLIGVVMAPAIEWVDGLFGLIPA